MLNTLTRITFGLSKPSGEAITTFEWETFVDVYIANRFTDGFTVISAEGGWRDAATGKLIRERSMIVEVIHDGSFDALAVQIAKGYKNLFEQDGVMITSVPSTTTFI
jgi:hypothetical protein